MDNNLETDKRRLYEIISAMTLEEKAGMCSGDDFWHLKGVQRLGICRLLTADGPHGLRLQKEKADHLGIQEPVRAVCFPTGTGMGASFDRELYHEMAGLLGEEGREQQVGILLGPAINCKRSPLCGRNFEYLSEDPFLSGEMAASYINGLQAGKVGACVKHYAANNQEKRRSTVSVEVNERALREIYLAAFEIAVKKGKPAALMCSYNRINGEYVSQSRRLLTEILREEWGFQGLVMTDWNACDERVPGLIAGQDLEMPSSYGVNDRMIVAAVRDGRLSEKVLDSAVERVLEGILRYGKEEKGERSEAEQEEMLKRHHEAAVKLAASSMVLLKNDTDTFGKKTLPLQKGKKYAFIGAYAKKPRFQGGGSSHIRPWKVTNAWQECQGMGELLYAQGYPERREEDMALSEKLLKEAVRIAGNCDAAVIFAGLSEEMESEAYDRENMKLPEEQNRLIEAVAESCPHTVVLLHNGGPVEMPWICKVSAVLECYLAGEATGEAQAGLLFGDFCPCAKLAETFPLRLQDTPSWLDFGRDSNLVHYGEGIFVGYRYYDTKQMEVLFPFGHGLSYTEFVYEQISVKSLAQRKTVQRDCGQTEADYRYEVSCRVKNAGFLAGKEIVQLYVHKPESCISRAWQELKGFETVWLEPGESRTVVLQLDRRSFAFYDQECSEWKVEPGEYEIYLGASSRDIRLTASVKILRQKAEERRWRCTRNTTFGELAEHPSFYQAYEDYMRGHLEKLPFENLLNKEVQKQLEPGQRKMVKAVIEDSPLRSIRSLLPGLADDAFLEKLIDHIQRSVDNGSSSGG